LSRLDNRLAEVATRLAADRGQLTAMLSHLATALTDVAAFVRENRVGLATDVTALADITGILVRQQQALVQILALAPLTLSNLLLAYNPRTGNLDLRNNITPTAAASFAPAAEVCALLVEELDPAAVPRECTELARTLTAQGGAVPEPLATLLEPAPRQRPALAGLYDVLLGEGGSTGDPTMNGILR